MRSPTNMTMTLFDHSKIIDYTYGKAKFSVPSLEVDINGLQLNLFDSYDNNSVLSDAKVGKLSIEDTIAELEQINRGIRKFLPRAVNKAHNDRLKDLGDLISMPTNLKTRGIFFPDNIITVATEIGIIAYAAFYAVSMYALPSAAFTPDQNELAMHLCKFVAPTALTAMAAPLTGAIINSYRITEMPIDEARYLDNKIKELYK